MTRLNSIREAAARATIILDGANSQMFEVALREAAPKVLRVQVTPQAPGFARYLTQDYLDRKTGIAWIEDSGQKLKPVIRALPEHIREYLVSPLVEDAVLADEVAEEPSDFEKGRVLRKVADEMRRKIKVQITPVTSPKTGKKGWKVSAKPTPDQIMAEADRRVSRSQF